MQDIARALAKTLNCQSPPRRAPNGMPLDSCDKCDSCRRIDTENHPDVLWIRPESKSRIVTIDQMRDLMQTMNLKPTIAEYKVGIIAAAIDRQIVAAANAFLNQPWRNRPPKSILLLLTVEPQRIMETIISRCLRLSFGGDGAPVDPARRLAAGFFNVAAEGAGGRSQDTLASSASSPKNSASSAKKSKKTMGENSKLEKYDEIEGKLKQKLEDELTAGIEAEYRRQRTDLIGVLQWWLRDAWLQTLTQGADLLTFPTMAATTKTVASRITPTDALTNLEAIDRLQRQLHTNVQEALALEVTLLKLKL